jgi:hyperosmotically inducible protein
LGLCSLTSLEAVLGRRMSSLTLFNLLVIILIPPSLTRNTPTLYGFQSMARAVTHSIDCQKDKKLLGADWGTRKSYHSSAGDKGEVMKAAKIGVSVIGSIILVAGVACSSNQQAPDISSDLRKALDQAGYTQVSASQDRDKGVVTLTGNVASDDDKSKAESIAKSVAGTEVVSDQIGVRPPGDESTAKKVDSALDSGIEDNLKAALVQQKFAKDVNYDVKNGVVTLKGDVHSQGQRASAEKLAKNVPNVKQVVNELDVKRQPATSTN